MLYPVELRAHGHLILQLNGRGREIRTPDILVPNQARYQTALYPDLCLTSYPVQVAAHIIDADLGRQRFFKNFFKNNRFPHSQGHSGGCAFVLPGTHEKIRAFSL